MIKMTVVLRHEMFKPLKISVIPKCLCFLFLVVLEVKVKVNT